MKKYRLATQALIVAFMATVYLASDAAGTVAGSFNCFYEWGEWPVGQCYTSQPALEAHCMAELCEYDSEECEDCETASATCDEVPDPYTLHCTYRDIT
jgi:hypothetical protein